MNPLYRLSDALDTPLEPADDHRQITRKELTHAVRNAKGKTRALLNELRRNYGDIADLDGRWGISRRDLRDYFTGP